MVNRKCLNHMHAQLFDRCEGGTLSSYSESVQPGTGIHNRKLNTGSNPAMD